MEIQELKSYTEADLRDMDELMHQLSATSYCDEKILQAIMDDVNSHLYGAVANDNVNVNLNDVLNDNKRIVGCACLCVAHTPEFTLGFVESVTVLSECRGQHIGRKLMEHLIAEAKRMGVQSLHLTSNPKRMAANGLYQAMGFVRYQTNCYTMIL